MIYIHRIALRSALGSDSERTLSRLADPEPFPETPVADAPGRSGADFERLAARWGKDVSPEPVTRGFLLVRDAAEEILSELDPAVREEVLASLSVVLGNATSGLNEALDAARRGDSDEILRAPLELGKVSAQLARSIGASGPDLTISTACTASGKAFCEAARRLLTGDVEYALAGGMDVLNPFTDAGFHALGAQSDVRSKPLAAERSGLHLGEGGALFLLSTKPTLGGVPAMCALSGWGETSDAHHLSAPHPEGRGAFEAMAKALSRAEVKPGDVDLVLLHGTATKQNDLAEAKALAKLFAGVAKQPLSASLKRSVGHQLAGAAAMNAAVAALLLSGDAKPPLALREAEDATLDPEIAALGLRPVTETSDVPVLKTVLANAFAFGGNNVSLVLTRTRPPARGWTTDELLAQKPPMRFMTEVDAVVCEEGRTPAASGRFTVPADHIMITRDGFPATGLIEVMAQTIGLSHEGRRGLSFRRRPASVLGPSRMVDGRRARSRRRGRPHRLSTQGETPLFRPRALIFAPHHKDFMLAPIVQFDLEGFCASPATTERLYRGSPDPTLVRLARSLLVRALPDASPVGPSGRFGLLVARDESNRTWGFVTWFREETKSLDELFHRLAHRDDIFARCAGCSSFPSADGEVTLAALAKPYLARIPETQQRLPNRSFLRGAFLRAAEDPLVRVLSAARHVRMRPVTALELWIGASPIGDVRRHNQPVAPEAVTLPIWNRLTSPFPEWSEKSPVAPVPDAVFVGETADAMVFDKPAGLLSVPGKTGDDLPTRLTRVTGIEPFVVHRLDMDTSGLILYAKTEEAQRELSQHFAQGRAKKTYRALLAGDVRQHHPEEGVIKLPLALNPLDRPRQCSLSSGRPAETHYRIERVREHPQFGTLSEVVFRPVTGRTHQLRLHAALGLGAPILGDPLYAPWRAAPAKRMCLHAETLLVPATKNAPETVFHAPIDWSAVL